MVNNDPQVNHQQHGPSESSTEVPQANGPQMQDQTSQASASQQNVLIAMENRLNELEAALEEEKRKNALLMSCGFGPQVGTKHTVHAEDEAMEGRSLKILSMVDKIPVPDDRQWEGTLDSRSAKRFLHQCKLIGRLNGLNAEAMFKYVSTKCIPSGLVSEIVTACAQALCVFPPDYIKAFSLLEAFFHDRFEATNRPDRLISTLESKKWATQAKSLDEFYRSFMLMKEEAELLGISFAEPVIRKYFVQALPDKLQVRVRDHCAIHDTPLRIMNSLTDWIAQAGGDHQFFKATPVRAIGTNRSLACFNCGSETHLLRSCPEPLKPHLEKRPANTGQAPAKQLSATQLVGSSPTLPSEDKPAKTISWSNVVKVAHATIQGGESLVEVVIKGLTASCVFPVKALLDTGSARCLCSQAFANKMYERGVIQDEDIVKGSVVELIYANGESGCPLGSVKSVIAGIQVEMLVVEKLNTDCIVGLDVLRQSRDLVSSLVNYLVKADDNSMPLCSSVMENEKQPLTEGSVMSLNSQHAKWGPVKLVWKTLKRPVTNTKAAIREAEKLERRLQCGDKEQLSAYQSVIDNWKENGWLQHINPKDVRYCLRHFPVKKEGDGKTLMSKCRLVVDGSSLTKHLETMECLHRDLLRNLVLFRLCQGFATADISSAYMRIAVDESARPFLCIAWKGKTYAFTSLPMGISPSAAFLQHAVNEFLQRWLAKFETERRELAANYEVLVVPYMDDLLVLIFHKDKTAKVQEDVEIEINDHLCKFFDNKHATGPEIY